MSAKLKMNVLILDDDSDAHRQAEEQLAKHAHVHSAYTITQASALLAETHFDFAFVDLHLGAEHGVAFLAKITEHAPSCPVVITTSWDKHIRGEVLSMIGNGSRIVGLIKKTGAQRVYQPPFAFAYRDWKARQVNVDGAVGVRGIAEALSAKRSQIDRDLKRERAEGPFLRTTDDAIESEVVALLCEVFGPTKVGNRRTPSLELPRIIRTGLSSSVVVEAIPSVSVPGGEKSQPGNRCIIKIGPRPEMQTEIQRYTQVVRFGVPLEYRVEMLGSALGDTLGLVCYSFAGSVQTDELVSLQDLFVGRVHGDGWSWPEVLTAMFESGAKSWYAVQGRTLSLTEYFELEYHARLGECHQKFDRFLGGVPLAPGLTLSEIKIRAQNKHSMSWHVPVTERYPLTLPAAEFLTRHGLSRRGTGCLSHGDLHGGNVLVDPTRATATFRFIDYRNSGLAPRMLDISALHASARLAHAEVLEERLGPDLTPEVITEMLEASVPFEANLVKFGRQVDSTDPWVGIAQALNFAAASNFREADQSELLWAQFAHCLSLFRLKDLTGVQQFRLVIWLSALTKQLIAAEGM